MLGTSATRSIALTLLVLALSLPAVAPVSSAHPCSADAYGSDPEDCDAHDCGPDRARPLEVVTHVHLVEHHGENTYFHGCGPLLHAGMDGNTYTYVCVAGDCVNLPLAGDVAESVGAHGVFSGSRACANDRVCVDVDAPGAIILA